MLRFGLILLVATSACAAPGYSAYEPVKLNIVPLDKFGPAKNTGRSNHLTDGLGTMFDGGEVNIHTITFNNIANDIASLQDKNAQGLALAQAITAALAQATGIPGDVCIATSLINAYATGNYQQALTKYINHIAKNLSLLVTLKKNPQAARFASGPRSGCSAGGRTYDFEFAWNAILDKAPPSSAGLMKEQYCTVRRLYNAFGVRSNNIASVVTATSLPPVTRIFTQAFVPLVNFVNALLGNGNVNQALNAAQNALVSSCNRMA